LKANFRLTLIKDLSRHVRAGHPWIWRDALARPPGAIESGAVVDVHDRGGFLARGLYDARSPIAVRIFTLDAHEDIDERLIGSRIEEALKSRRGAIDPAETNAFRMVHGEGDYLPGIVVDLYRDTAIVRFDGEAARAWAEAVANGVRAAARPLGVERIFERSRGATGRVLRGSEPPAIIEVRESGVRFAVDVLHGQKTGTFLDQRENRRAIRPYCVDLEVANLFSYAGGFSVHAALAGARRVTSIDSAAAALDSARDNFALNGLDPAQHTFECMDVFEWLAQARTKRRTFGLLIVDPPSFAPSEKSVDKALGAYRDLFAAALALVEPGGILAASSCSSHVDMESFLGALRDAGTKARRAMRVLEVRGQPADHPTVPAFKEGRYLKFVIARAR
jgi:23S rRNA (cytosine1962-C5)-methyltransferase